jgi:hypothetical protein
VASVGSRSLVKATGGRLRNTSMPSYMTKRPARPTRKHWVGWSLPHTATTIYVERIQRGVRIMGGLLTLLGVLMVLQTLFWLVALR